MGQNNAELIAKRGFIANLIFRDAWNLIKVQENYLIISDGNKNYSLAVTSLSEPTQVRPFLFWSHLIITSDKKRYTFKGFNRKSLEAISTDLNNTFSSFAIKTLESDCSSLMNVYREIKNFTSKGRYLRDSERRKLVVVGDKALEIQNHHFWKQFSSKKLKDAFHSILDFTRNSEQLVKSANLIFVEDALNVFKQFFDTVEKNPLTNPQRRACVINEDNNLVLAGAGTGKTSTMIGRAGYLLASDQASPDQILMLAYGKKAMLEMQERQDKCLRPWLNTGTPTIKTFHAIGLDIIKKSQTNKPSISPFVEDSHSFARFLDKLLQSQLNDEDYKSVFIEYFASYMYPYRNPFDFETMQEYNGYVRKNELRTLQGEVVKSFEECEIANFFLQHGVKYKYEEPYKINTTSPDFRQYKPDYYLPDYDIYIEHFALDKLGKPPKHFDQQKYLDGITWKRDLHARHKTKLLETYSYQKRDGTLLTNLADKLQKSGVVLTRRNDEELLAELKGLGKVSEFAKLLSDFLVLFKESYLSWTEVLKQAKAHIDSDRLCILLEIFKPIFDGYQEHLKSNNEIDFADMIGIAIDAVESNRFVSPYTHILVDEFQDISKSRARLILALLRQNVDSVFFAVGDDWQSIYRFTGSDIGVIKNFQTFFGASAITALDTTFRFNNSIGDVASMFVLKNPEQIKKTIGSITHVSEPAVSLLRVIDQEKGLILALDSICKRVQATQGKKTSVMVLDRYRFLFDSWQDNGAKRRIINKYPSLELTWLTVHASKGKEADFVVVLEMGKGKYGFPSEKENDAILEFLLPNNEKYLFAEERRLFYVAMTRARHRVYLVYDPSNASSFIRELAKKGYAVCTNEFDELHIDKDIADISCPLCMTGDLVPKKSKNGAFVGCNQYPFCKYTERACLQCGDLLKTEGRFKICTNSKCNAIEPICPACGDLMIKRNGPYGEFWGCRNYGRSQEIMCTHTENRIVFPGFRANQS